MNRLVAATEAKDSGRGGNPLVYQACGLSRNALTGTAASRRHTLCELIDEC